MYDPFINKDIVERQFHTLDDFLSNIDIIVILVGHNEIRNNMDLLSGKVIFDTRNICNLENVYRL